MINREFTRKLLAGAALIFISTLATLMARQFNVGPERPSPDFRAFGPANAPIHIYEYTDFACPSCKAAQANMEQVLEVYKDSIRLNFKHYPLLMMHPWSLHAAAYADCAGKQGKFMDYAKLLFENQDKWAKSKELPKEFTEFAKELKLDVPAIQACSNDDATLKQLKLDIAEAELKGVNATPTFFINGKRAVGAAQFLDQVKRFDNLLKKRSI